MIRRLQLVGIFALLLLGFSPAAEEKRLTIYSPQSNFTISVSEHNAREYVSLTDLLDPFGQATLTPGGKRWKLKLTMSGGSTAEGEFTENSLQAKLRGKKISLAAAFLVDNARGYIPLTSAHIVLSQLLGLNAVLRENSRRLFVGDVAITYSADLQKGNPAKLVLHFSAPVNPTIATEPGRVRLSFTRDPLVASSTNPQLEDSTIRSTSFSESNGSAEITVATSAPVLASFSDNNRTITLAPAPFQVAETPASNSTNPPVIPGSAPTTPPALPAPTATLPTRPRFVVIIDPAHGGTDPGAALADGLFEKDITLAIGRRLRADLDQRGIAAVLLRDGDATLTADQRASVANASRAGIYIAIHAATMGSGVRLYSARLSTSGSTRHGFLPWNTAQATYLEQSHNLEASLITELDSRHIAAIPLESGLRPLRNIAKPAIAIEVAPSAASLESITSAVYQQAIATSIGAAVANVRGSTEGTR